MTEWSCISSCTFAKGKIVKMLPFCVELMYKENYWFQWCQTQLSKMKTLIRRLNLLFGHWNKGCGPCVLFRLQKFFSVSLKLPERFRSSDLEHWSAQLAFCISWYTIQIQGSEIICLFDTQIFIAILRVFEYSSSSKYLLFPLLGEHLGLHKSTEEFSLIVFS